MLRSVLVVARLGARRVQPSASPPLLRRFAGLHHESAIAPGPEPTWSAGQVFVEEDSAEDDVNEITDSNGQSFRLNENFWGRFKSLPHMATATDKAEVLHIVDNFLLVRRIHRYLFQRLKVGVLANLDQWSAPELAQLCNAWAQLGWMHEDLLVAMSGRVTATLPHCNAQQLCWLLDAYATARCSVHSVLAAVVMETYQLLEDFTLTELCLHASSFARLGSRENERLLDMMAQRMMRLLAAGEPSSCTARDLVIAAHGYASLGFSPEGLFDAIACRMLKLHTHLSARDIQVLCVALARVGHHDHVLLVALAMQAQRRTAQFTAESLALTLRSMAFFGVGRPLFTRTVLQLPRLLTTSCSPAAVVTIFDAFAAAEVKSLAVIDLITPWILERSSSFTATDWLMALRAYAELGHRDDQFMSALHQRLKFSTLTSLQLSNCMAQCALLARLKPAGL